jgi:phosphotransacetylase
MRWKARMLGMRHDLIRPIFVGRKKKIEAVAEEIGEDISGIEIVDIDNHAAAAARGVAMVHEDRVGAIMKGHLHTDELLSHVVKRDGGLRTRTRISHVFVMDVPGLDHLLIVTDAAINIAPDLPTKADIVQNAINVALSLGIEQPKAGILSAVETVNPKIPSTVDAAALSKMAERGQITGGLVDGPLAMDNALNLQAARTKGLKSLVAGRADILVAPNIESANMMAKELTFAANAEAGGLVVGARVPVIVTSRADDEKARLAACAMAALYQDWRRKQLGPLTPADPGDQERSPSHDRQHPDAQCGLVVDQVRRLSTGARAATRVCGSAPARSRPSGSPPKLRVDAAVTHCRDLPGVASHADALKAILGRDRSGRRRRAPSR